MNAITIIQAVTAPATREQWLDGLKGLLEERRDVDWRIGDALIAGKTAGHLKQTGFDFLSEELGLNRKRVNDAIKAAEVFPPALRVPALSLEHHAAVASLPRDEALPLLKRASIEHLSVNECREVVTQHRYNTGQRFDDEDTDSTLCTHIVRAWNRGTPDARELAFTLLKSAAAQGFTIVDEDEATDAEE